MIPWDKSWVIRMGILDLLAGSDRTEVWLKWHKTELSDDLVSLQRALGDWRKDGATRVRVGESGTLYRFLKYTSAKQHQYRDFTTVGTLTGRVVNEDNVTALPQTLLLALDGGTSQWASAAALNGDPERLPDAPFKLQVTYDAIDHYRATQGLWEAREDATIRRQADAIWRWAHGGVLNFEPEQAEDYCLARAMEITMPDEGKARWPQLRFHESDRLAEMEEQLHRAAGGVMVTSPDHRVIQACAAWIYINRPVPNDRYCDVLHPLRVSKSWPQFWLWLQSIHG